MKRIELAPGAYLNLLPADKFNRCRVNVQLRYPADRARATALALLPFLMERCCADHPDMTDLSCHLARLYGADLAVDSTAAGSGRCLSVTVGGIAPRFALSGEDLAGEYLALALGVAFRPHFADGMFLPEEVEIEKEKLAEELAAEINDKRMYCLRQARRRFYGSHPAGIERTGYADEVKGLTAETVTEAWRWMVENAQLEVFCAGIPEELAARRVREALAPLTRTPQPLLAPVQLPAAPLVEETERMEMVQAKLCMLFTVEDFQPSRDLDAMRVAMAVLGGSPTSRLFTNVREKQSLCYYCAASFNSFGGMMCIDSGVLPENAARAREAILHEWQTLCSQPPAEAELEDARRFVANSLAAVEDSLAAQETWYSGQLWRGDTAAPDEARRALEKVTADEVAEQMKKFRFAVCYLLTKEDTAE